ncbi:MAG: hypothetical protein LC687_07600, partial [Actinobacteria bacterium]|nr:hypothetical protein [Actinomycetota bacterium]
DARLLVKRLYPNLNRSKQSAQAKMDFVVTMLLQPLRQSVEPALSLTCGAMAQPRNLSLA